MGHETRTVLDYLFDQGLDIRDRRVFLQGPLAQAHPEGEQSWEPGKNPVEHVIRSLLYLDKTAHPKGIEFWINTPGGDLEQMFAIYDIMRICQNQITTIAYGEVCSAGCLLLVGGDLRLATKNAWFMAHEDQLSNKGPGFTVEADMKATARQRERWYSLIAKHTKHSKGWWLKEIRERRNIWWDTRQMLQHGVIDEVLPEKL